MNADRVRQDWFSAREAVDTIGRLRGIKSDEYREAMRVLEGVERRCGPSIYLEFESLYKAKALDAGTVYTAPVLQVPAWRRWGRRAVAITFLMIGLPFVALVVVGFSSDSRVLPGFLVLGMTIVLLSPIAILDLRR